MSRAANKYKENIYGFTLIEVTVALSILMLIGLGVVQAFPFGSLIVKDSKNQTNATYVAQSKIEELISMDYFSIPVGIIEPKQKIASSSSYLYEFERETSVYYLGDDFISTSTNPVDDIGLKTVNIDVFYNNAFSKNEVGYRLNYVISQR